MKRILIILTAIFLFSFHAEAQNVRAQVSLEAFNSLAPTSVLSRYPITTDAFGQVVLNLPISINNYQRGPSGAATYLNRLVLLTQPGGPIPTVQLKGVAQTNYALTQLASYSSPEGNTKVFSIPNMSLMPEQLCVIIDWGDDDPSYQIVNYVMGDINRDSFVSLTDFLYFRNVFGSSLSPMPEYSTGYGNYLTQLYFNYNNNNTIDQDDFAVFRAQFGSAVPTGFPCF